MPIVQPEELLPALLKQRQSGKTRKGLSTGFQSVDEFMLLNKKYLMLVTGYPSYGKSEFMDALALNTAIMHNWNWLYFSPESDDFSTNLRKLVCKKIGKPLIHASEREIADATRWANERFAWIDAGDAMYSLDDVLNETRSRIECGYQVDVMVIDPWNELDHSKQAKRDDQYISDMLLKLRKFHRKYDVLSVIVVHPHAVEKDKNGVYPIPHLRTCAGGALWWNKADYGICIHRKDFNIHGAHVFIQKVKDTTIGYQGQTFLDYEVPSGRFKDQHAISFDLPEPPDAPPF